MKTHINHPIKLAAFLITLGCVNTQAAVNWYWDFDQTLYTVSPTESIVVTVSLHNDPSSTGQLTAAGTGGSFTGDMQKSYNFSWGWNGSEFAGLDLPPGGSFHFTWGTLTPIKGFVLPGTYGPDPASFGAGGTE